MNQCSECGRDLPDNEALMVTMEDNLNRPHKVCQSCFASWFREDREDREEEST